MNDRLGLLVGAALAALTVVAVVLLPQSSRRGFLAVDLGIVAGIYIGFALADGSPRSMIVEIAWAAATAGAALLGLLVSPIWLAVGFFAHGAWDVIHHAPVKVIRTGGVPDWYAPACLLYDLPVAALVLLVRV